MAYWILKSEPTTYSFDDLMNDKKTTWDGVRNAQALINIRSMRRKDLAMIYHSNAGKCMVGIAKIVTDPYPDGKMKDPRLVVVDVVPIRRLTKEVTLAAIKANSKLSDLKLIKQSRLSVIPVHDTMWQELMRMGDDK